MIRKNGEIYFPITIKISFVPSFTAGTGSTNSTWLKLDNRPELSIRLLLLFTLRGDNRPVQYLVEVNLSILGLRAYSTVYRLK